MPFIPDEDANIPDEPHLGLMTTPGEFTAIPKGATMAIIIDPTRADGIIPMVLTRVSLKGLRFICACGRNGCTRKLVFKLHREGYHPSRLGQ